MSSFSTLPPFSKKEPLVVLSGPMHPFATSPLALAISAAGGLGFVASSGCPATLDAAQKEYANEKYNDLRSSCTNHYTNVQQSVLPLGVGFQVWKDKLEQAKEWFSKYNPIGLWFHAYETPEEVKQWTSEIKAVSPLGDKLGIYVQVGTVQEARSIIDAVDGPIFLILQGSDAGGHQRVNASSIVTLIPEVYDTMSESERKRITLIAAGGIIDARAAAAALVLGAEGVVLGTRLLASKEAAIPAQFQETVLNTTDGGVTTRKTRLFDDLRGTSGFPLKYDGRALVNKSVIEEDKGRSMDDLKADYAKELDQSKQDGKGYDEHGRLVVYVGSGVGLVRGVKSAGEIVKEVRDGAGSLLGRK